MDKDMRRLNAQRRPMGCVGQDARRIVLAENVNLSKSLKNNLNLRETVEFWNSSEEINHASLILPL